MLYLISAPPRTGKTLKAIEIIFKHLNQGRVVYTNIVGIKIPGVITFSSEMNQPHDWRDLPNDSVVIYDEAHEHPAFADRNLIQDKKKMADIRDIGISLTLHGHFGFDIYMITQNPRLLCAEVLASVGTHYIMRRKFGYDMATIFEYAEAKTTFSKHTAQDALNRTFWRYPKHLYKFYVSSEVHNIKKTFPAKYYAFAVVPILLFGYGYLKAAETGFFGFFGKPEQVQAKADQDIVSDQSKNTDQDQAVEGFKGIDERTNAQREADYQAELQRISYNVNKPYEIDYSGFQYEVQQVPQFAGCVKYNGKYYGYTQQGTRLDVSQADCKRYMSGDRPFNPFQSPVSNNYVQGNTSINTADNHQPTVEQMAKIEQLQTEQRPQNYVQQGLQNQRYANNQASL